MRWRRKRINELIREKLSELLRRQVNDPRLGGLVTVTEVDTSPDLRYAKVFVSIMGSDDEKSQALQGLRAASGYLHRELRGWLALRHIPELTFYQDDSIDHGAHILQLIKQVTANDPDSADLRQS